MLCTVKQDFLSYMFSLLVTLHLIKRFWSDGSRILTFSRQLHAKTKIDQPLLAWANRTKTWYNTNTGTVAMLRSNILQVICLWYFILTKQCSEWDISFLVMICISMSRIHLSLDTLKPATIRNVTGITRIGCLKNINKINI